MPPQSEIFRSHIDEPTHWGNLPECLSVRGWCFASDGTAIHGIRLSAADRCLHGTIGLPRADVRVALPSAPDAHTGFRIHGVLPAGRYELRLEAQLADAQWHLVAAYAGHIRRRRTPLWWNGRLEELLCSQFPCHMLHAARPVAPEKFPVARAPLTGQPRLSIVTPSYQQAAYLPETIRSVLSQSNIRGEYVVQDGGSSDGSADIIRQHATDFPSKGATAPVSRLRPMAWESRPDRGQSDAIIQAFAKTSGGPDDVMAWINSDDCYLPGALAFVTDYFARHPAVDVVYGHRILIDESSQEIGRWHLPAHDAEVLRLYDLVPQETLFWRRRLWDRVGGLNPAYQFAMDWDLLLRFQAAGARIVRIPRFLACFRIHARQKTSAAMHTTGQREIDALRAQNFSPPPTQGDLENHARLLGYLRRSAWLRSLWQLGLA